MKVRYDEGVANHIGLEPCAVSCKDEGEASAEEFTGQPLSRVRIGFPGADTVAKVEGHMTRYVIASISSARRGRRTWHVEKLFAREPGDPKSDQRKETLVRAVKARSRNR